MAFTTHFQPGETMFQHSTQDDLYRSNDAADERLIKIERSWHKRAQIKLAFNLVYRSGLNASQAKERLRAETGNPFAAEFADFLDHAKRGICRPSFGASDEPADA